MIPVCSSNINANAFRRLAALCLLAFAALGFGNPPLKAQVAVIAHRSVPVDTLTPDDLLDLYTLEVRRWSDGQPVVVLDLKKRDRVKTAFYDYIGKSPSRMKSVWMINMLSGEGKPPDAMLTEEEMLERVAGTPGAVGFIRYALATDQVKVLALIDVAPENVSER